MNERTILLRFLNCRGLCMWRTLLRQWHLGLGLIVLISCFLAALRMCDGGSCLSLQNNRSHAFHSTLHQWVKEDGNFSAADLKESCMRKEASTHRDYDTIKLIEEQANSGATLNEVLEASSMQKLQEIAPKLGALGVLQKAQLSLRMFLNSSAYSGFRLKMMQNATRRGIVIAAGGLVPLTNTYSTLYVLRHVHKSSLPVEIYYNGIAEFDHQMQAAFQRDFSDVSCHDVSRSPIPIFLQPPSSREKLFQQQIGFSLKARMLLLTSFAEVLVLDSDSIPLCDPELLFNLPEYRAAGNMFWPDFWAKDRHCPGPVYSGLNLTDPWQLNPLELTVESGQFLVNRRKHFDVIQYMVMLNMYGEFTYKLLLGDKDTYRLAFSMANKAHSFLQVKVPPANAMRGPADITFSVSCDEVFPDISINASSQPQMKTISDERIQEELSRQDAYKHAGMIQMTPQGQMVFLHHTADSKWDPRRSYTYFSAPISYVTFPLNPDQAAEVFLKGDMLKEKFSIRDTSHCPTGKGLNLLDTISQCCVNSVHEDPTKVPMLPAHLFTSLVRTVESGFRIFQDWQISFLKDTNPLSSLY